MPQRGAQPLAGVAQRLGWLPYGSHGKEAQWKARPREYWAPRQGEVFLVDLSDHFNTNKYDGQSIGIPWPCELPGRAESTKNVSTDATA